MQYRIGLVLILYIGIAILVTAIVLAGCATTSQFNSDDIQDGPCYSDYGGQHGYCDKGVSR